MNLAEQRAHAATVPCPKPPHGCAAPIGEPCRNLQTREPLENRPAHEARLWNADAIWGGAA